MASSGVPPSSNFFVQPVNNAVYTQKGRYLEIGMKHLNTEPLTGAQTLTFKLPTMHKNIFNFNESYFKMRLRVTTPAGANADPREVKPTNGIAHTLWRKIEVFANGHPSSTEYQAYGYKKIIEHQLSADRHQGYHEDLWGFKKRVPPPGQAERVRDDGPPVVQARNAISNLDRDTQRGQLHFESDTYPGMYTDEGEMFTFTPAVDIFQTETNVVSLANVTWEIKLTPNDPEHYLNWCVNWGPNLNQPAADFPDVVGDYVIRIVPDSMKFMLRCELMKDHAYVAAIEAAKNTDGFILNYHPTSIRTFSIPHDRMSFEAHDMMPRHRPTMVALFLINHEAYNGVKHYNPYLFMPPEELRRILYFYDGEQQGEQQPIDLSTDAGRLEMYRANMRALGIKEYASSLMYGWREMTKGFFCKIISFDSDINSTLEPNPSIGLHDFKMEFQPALERGYTVIVYTKMAAAKFTYNVDGTVHNDAAR